MSNYEQAIRDLKSATDEVKRFAEASTTELRNLGKVTEETKASTDKALAEMNGLSARLADIEQKAARAGQEGAGETRSLGQRFVESDEVKSAMSRGDRFSGRVAVEMKAITSGAPPGISSGLLTTDRLPGIVPLTPDRHLTIRNLLMPGTTSAGSIDYVRETGFTNNAAAVAENPAGGKPQSNIIFDRVTIPVQTIAHWVSASRQILADAPMLASYVDVRLRYGLAFKEEDQLLNGNGEGNNVKGLLEQASDYSQPAGVTVKSETMIDRLRLAMLQATLAEFPATGHVLNPTDWTSIEMTKDTQGRYVFANPTGLAGPVLWGLPVVQSLSMKANNFLTGAFSYAAQIFDRESVNVIISDQDRDNVITNMVTILVEERLALAVYRPQALIKGSFTADAATGKS